MTVEPASSDKCHLKTLLVCLAAASRRRRVLEYLMDHGANLGGTPVLYDIKRWRTPICPLHCSDKYDHARTTRLLLKHSAYYNSQIRINDQTYFVEVAEIPREKSTLGLNLLLNLSLFMHFRDWSSVI